MADPSDKQRPWRPVRPSSVPSSIEDELSTGAFTDDEAPTGMVPRHLLERPLPPSKLPGVGHEHDLAAARMSQESDMERTLVDVRVPVQPSRSFQGTARGDGGVRRYTPLPGTPQPAPLPTPPRTVEPDEFLLDELPPVIDEPAQHHDELRPPRMPSNPLRLPTDKSKPALPLPAPPSRSEPVPALPRAAVPRHDTPAGPQRSPSHHGYQAHPGHKAHSSPPRRAPERVPVPIEDHERVTAVATDPLAPLRTPLIGGRYRIIERIGAGGMGKVFKVTHAQLGKTFALKIISESMADDDKIRELFYREARMASSLSHPNVTSVVDFGEDAKLGAFMVMEFIEGEPLSKRLHREERLGIRLASDIIRQVGEALDYIHSKGIVHCDIKAENILLLELPGTQQRRSIQAKLLDFGLAKSTVAGRSTQSLAGTPHYVAPERIRGAQPSPATDIYGLGILYYEMLTGKVPFDGSVDQILHGHLEVRPVPPSQLVEGGLDPALENLIMRALAKTPAERHKDVAAFMYELQTVMDMLGYGRPGRRRRGAAKRVVSRTPSQRDETARALFDASRVPMALIGRDGLILIANPAFSQFIMGVSIDVEGLNVQATPLVGAWATFDADLGRACAGTSMRRTIEVDADGVRTRKLLMWLDPGLSEDQAIFGVHPLEES